MSSGLGDGQAAGSHRTVSIDRHFEPVLASRHLMKLGPPIVLSLAALFLLSPSPRADEMRLDDVVARATRDVVVRSALEDNALLELRHRALLDVGGAEVSLALPLAAGTRVPAGPITVRGALALAPLDERVRVIELRVADLRRVLERGAGGLASYTWEEGRPLWTPGADDSSWVSVDGLSYEIDLTAPPGQRIVHMALRGAEPDSSRTLKVAATASTLARLGLTSGAGEADVRFQDVLLARLRKMRTLDGACDHNWSVLPDYATTPERGLIDRLVRLGVAPREEVMRLFPDQPARRGDLAYWLARAYGWREQKFSGAFLDIPDSLEPWVDGLVRRRLIGSLETEESFQPFAAIRLPMVLDWCENAARHERYALDTEPERQSFRRGLLTATTLLSHGRPVGGDTISRGQLLGLICNARFPVVRVLHTTDFHGAMEPIEQRGRMRGGSAVLASVVAELRAENPEGTVLLDGGDAFQGTMISNLAYGRAVVEQMNRLGYTAMAIGNHEFDWSVDTLARRVGEMRFAALGANITLAGSGRRPRWARTDTLFTRRGVRVGVFGLAYPGTPSATQPRNVTSLRFGDDSTAAAVLAPALHKRGAEAVVALGHVPGVMDSAGVVGGRLGRLAHVPGVDLWLGGHSHTWVDGEVRGIPAMIPGSRGEGVAVCDLVVDPTRDRVVERHHRLVPTWGADQVTPDSAMRALVERWGRAVEREAQVPVGACAQRLGKQRGGESAIGSLVADVMRGASGAEVGLQNNGGLRAELPEGPVTRGTLYQVIPFDNTIVTMALTGAEIRQVLEEALAGERVVQVSGIRYRFDLGRQVGSRVTALLDAQGQALDERRTYRVAVNDFMAAAGDDLVTLAHGRARVDTDLGVRQALEDWVRENSARGAFRYQGDQRVLREPGSRPPARGD